MRVREFSNEIAIDKDINKWLEDNPCVQIIDIKYSANENSSNALVVYRIVSE